MACGTPVVTARGSALEEWYGDAALLADARDPGDVARAIRRVIEEPGLAASLAARGARKASTLDWSRTAAGIAAALGSAAGMA
jgi:glycosyltransferase involved in cell wall biosynthesis